MLGYTGVEVMSVTIGCLLLMLLAYSQFVNPPIGNCTFWAERTSLEICQLQWHHSNYNRADLLKYDDFMKVFEEYQRKIDKSRWDVEFDFPPRGSGYLFSVIFIGKKNEKTEGFIVVRKIDSHGLPSFLRITTP